MRNYQLYEVTDFVLDEAFIRWVKDKNPKDELFWKNWLDLHSSKQLVVAEARIILESMKINQTGISAEERNNEINKVLHTIRIREQPKMKNRLIPVYSLLRAAIVVTVIAGVAVIFKGGFKKDDLSKFNYATAIASRHLIEQLNTSGKPVKTVLPDGSTAELASGSRISYANGFDSSQTRDVYLSGEAFFTVVKNPQHPFRVFANEIITKVLGTSFSVRSFEKDRSILITVRTGKVSVYSQVNTNDGETAKPNKLGGMILTPNQQLVYEKDAQKFQKNLLEQPVIIVPDVFSKNMLYEDVPVVKIFAQLQKSYGVSIVYDAELLKDCTITADLTDESLYHKLDLICQAINANYEIVDAQLIIHASGCR